MTTIKTMRGALGQGLVVLGLWLGVAAAGQATETVIYYHTDALGSPVAETDASGQVIASSRRTYEPYGKQLSPQPLEDGPNYTGHVLDAATGLLYMQQRYYDPAIGRFLSVDPVTALSGGGFSRYSYAANNPYRYYDPDGRLPKLNDQKPPDNCNGGPCPTPESDKPDPPPPLPSPFTPAQAQAIAQDVFAHQTGNMAKKWEDLSSAATTRAIAYYSASRASQFKSFSNIAGKLSSGIGLGSGGYEIFSGIKNNDRSSIGHGGLTVSVAGMTLARILQPEIALGWGVIDFGASFIRYQSNDGEQHTGWDALGSLYYDAVQENAEWVNY